MAYQLLHEAAKKYTETLVIDAAVDTEGAMTAELPMELLDILQRSLNLEDAEDHNEVRYSLHPLHPFRPMSANISTGMVRLSACLDGRSRSVHRRGACGTLHGVWCCSQLVQSLKVKSGYIDQIRDLDLVAAKLLPTLFSLLDLYGGIAKAFKLDIWDIDEFYLDCKPSSSFACLYLFTALPDYTSDSTISLRLLAAHVYYRTLLLLPSLIRTWLADCRDRQLSTAVASYTSKHFSPAIIRTELARVKDPNVATELSGENVTIKVASAVNEVTAGFSVDEQQLELTVKLPVDWPLHTIEVKDAKHVGVTDDRWRAWELGVQQILTFRVRAPASRFAIIHLCVKVLTCERF